MASSNISLEALSSKEAASAVSLLRISYGFHNTPLGRCLLSEFDGKICYLAFAPNDSDREVLTDLSARWPGAEFNCDQEYTARMVKDIFSDSGSRDGQIELLVRGTQFQVAVWEALLAIPPGSVCSYAEVAQRVGRPKAVRAVGSAIGANPIAWLIPCHRVVRSDGGLGGYRWGLEAKKACLDFEKNQ